MTKIVDIIPGNNVRVANKKAENRPTLVLFTDPADPLVGYVTPSDNSVLEILSKPKKYQGYKCVKVKWQEKEYFTYYCNIRFDTQSP